MRSVMPSSVTVSWGFFRGALIEDVMRHTPLVDLEYLVTLTEQVCIQSRLPNGYTEWGCALRQRPDRFSRGDRAA